LRRANLIREISVSQQASVVAQSFVVAFLLKTAIRNRTGFRIATICLKAIHVSILLGLATDLGTFFYISDALAAVTISIVSALVGAIGGNGTSQSGQRIGTLSRQTDVSTAAFVVDEARSALVL